ncbi:hypothetical protein IE81DRAFT_15872 [Ceraceosorus guamensis]|uniref:Pali-domain-containing protein n=1 Tax=Ceraceosorus guamensis TaxID=1522189 RepID=A0A316VPU4_9BASI|nr:hypothetical protein IE81DRAFT_15872 [Ceraceosorus guamensis]PWN39597.1 hypothetical protein IE81DRAFT_15872 [Ceraceosorus guamensis]
MPLLSRLSSLSPKRFNPNSSFRRFDTDSDRYYPHPHHAHSSSTAGQGPISILMSKLGMLHASENKWVQFTLAWLPVALALANWIIQLLVSIGLPTILSIDFLRFDLSFAQFSIFGIWTICTGTPEETLVDGTVINPASFSCPSSSLGWKDTTYSTIVEVFFGTEGGGLPKALVVHPLSCAFSFFALISLLVGVKKPNLSAPLLVCITFLLTLVAFIIDLAIFVPAHRRLSDPSAINTLGQAVIDVRYGAAFWLTLVTLVLSALMLLLVLSAHKSRRRQRNISAGGWSYEMDKPLTSSDREAGASAGLGLGFSGSSATAAARAERGDAAGGSSSLHSLSRNPSRTTASTPTAFGKSSSAHGGGRHSRNASSNLNLEHAAAASEDLEGALDQEVDYGSRGRRKALEKLEDKDKDE